MKKIVLLAAFMLSIFMPFQAQDGIFKNKSFPTLKENASSFFNFPSQRNKLSARAATSIDTLFFGHMWYTANYAKAYNLNCPGNRYSSLGTTSVQNSILTDYVNPASDGRFSEAFTIYDTIYDVGLTSSNVLVRKAYLLDSAASIFLDTVFVQCGLITEDTTLKPFAGDSINFSLYTVNKASKAKQTLIKKVSYNTQADLVRFFNNGFIYNAPVEFKTNLPLGTSAFGILVEYKTVHKDTNLFALLYNRLDSCVSITVGASTFTSPSMRPLFPGYTTWRVIDSTSPTNATTIQQGNDFAYSTTTLPGIPSNCRFLYSQNFYILPKLILESKFYANLVSSPQKTTYCANDKVIFSPDIKGGKAPYTYQWASTSGTIDNATDPAIELTVGTANTTVTLTITDANNDKITLTRTFNVNNVTTTLSATKTALNGCGDTSEISITVTGGTANSYSWNPPSGVTTSKIKVTGPNTYKVTVTTTNGCSSAASIDITSSASTYVIPSFDTPAANTNCATVSGTYTLADPQTDWTYTWKTGSTTMGSGASVDYTFPTIGKKTITLSATNGGCTATPRTQTVTVKAGKSGVCTNSILNSNLSDQITIFPNPVKDGILNVKNESSNSVSVKVTDLLGKTVSLDKMNGLKTGTVDLSNVSNGVYFVEIESKNDRIVRKVLIDKQ